MNKILVDALWDKKNLSTYKTIITAKQAVLLPHKNMSIFPVVWECCPSTGVSMLAETFVTKCWGGCINLTVGMFSDYHTKMAGILTLRICFR